jgi:branched-chain amino acid transport system permease protein
LAGLLKKSISGNMQLKKIAFLLTALGIAILLPLIFQNPYYIQIGIMIGVNAILAMGLVMLLSTGLVTLGSAAYWAVGAYASTLLVMKMGFNFWLALLVSGSIAGMIGLGIGAVIIRLSKVAFTFVTIIIGIIVTLVVGRVEFFGGWGGIVSIPKPDPIPLPFNITIDFTTRISYYYFMLFLLLLTVLVFFALYNSRIGRAWKAIKLNLQLAETLGINSYLYALLAFVISSIFAGLAGSFYAHTFHTIEPETFGFWRSIYIQVYAILGGVDFYIFGPIVGSIVLTFLPEVFRITKEIEPIITAVILLIIVIFLPGGLLSLPTIIQNSRGLRGKENLLLALFRRNKISGK